MSVDRRLRDIPSTDPSYKPRLESTWAEIVAKAQAVEVKRAQKDTEKPQPKLTTENGLPIGGWSRVLEDDKDEGIDERAAELKRLREKPPEPESDVPA